MSFALQSHPDRACARGKDIEERNTPRAAGRARTVGSSVAPVLRNRARRRGAAGAGSDTRPRAHLYAGRRAALGGGRGHRRRQDPGCRLGAGHLEPARQAHQGRRSGRPAGHARIDRQPCALRRRRLVFAQRAAARRHHHGGGESPHRPIHGESRPGRLDSGRGLELRLPRPARRRISQGTARSRQRRPSRVPRFEHGACRLGQQ